MFNVNVLPFSARNVFSIQHTQIGFKEKLRLTLHVMIKCNTTKNEPLVLMKCPNQCIISQCKLNHKLWLETIGRKWYPDIPYVSVRPTENINHNKSCTVISNTEIVRSAYFPKEMTKI
jgi:hypothetical protein